LKIAVSLVRFRPWAPFPAKHCCSETAFAAAKAFATCRDGRLARGLRVARSNVIQDFAPPAH